MKKINKNKKIWKEVISFPNLLAAAMEVIKVKPSDSSIVYADMNVTQLCMDIHIRLKNGTWVPIPGEPFIKHEKKTRSITPILIEGKIVGQAIYRVVRPYLECKYIFESHACVKGHGQHMSALRTQKYFFVTKSNEIFSYKGDIHHYFQSVDHDILKFILKEYFIKDIKLLKLIYTFIDAFSEGIPIGWLTSEMLANIYLYLFDKFIMKNFPDLHYVRFMDDFVISGTDRKRVLQAAVSSKNFLDSALKLETNVKSKIYKNHVDFCGYVIYKQYMIPRGKVIDGVDRRIKKYIRYGEFTKMIMSLNSFFGYIKFSMCRSIVYNLIYKIFNKIYYIGSMSKEMYYHYILDKLDIKDQLIDLEKNNREAMVTREVRIKRRVARNNKTGGKIAA